MVRPALSLARLLREEEKGLIQHDNAMALFDYATLNWSGDLRFRILVGFGICTRECRGLIADTSLSGQRVARKLNRIIADRGMPKMVISDNGTEFTSNAILG